MVIGILRSFSLQVSLSSRSKTNLPNADAVWHLENAKLFELNVSK